MHLHGLPAMWPWAKSTLSYGKQAGTLHAGHACISVAVARACALSRASSGTGVVLAHGAGRASGPLAGGAGVPASKQSAACSVRGGV